MSFSISYGQCILSANHDTPPEVTACLSACGCTHIIIPDGVSITMAETWDLRGTGVTKITIQGSSSSLVFDDGILAAIAYPYTLLMPDNAKIKMDTANTTAIHLAPGASDMWDTRIIFGGVPYLPIIPTTYGESDFANIISEGGLNIDGPLPVELSYFRADANESEIILSWETTMEINNNRFEVYRSSNLEDWEKIGEVESFGNSSGLVPYSFVDNNPKQNVNYYYLKQVDYDGESENFKVASAKVEKDNQLTLFPNPAHTNLNILTRSSENRISSYIIRDFTGDAAKFGKLVLNKNNIDISGIENGVYVFQLIDGGEITSIKLVVQH